MIVAAYYKAVRIQFNPYFSGGNISRRADRLLGELHIPKDSVAGREELEKHLEVRRAQEDDGGSKRIRRGWCLGGETFRQELLEQARKQTGDSRATKLKIETEEQNKFKLA